MGPSPQGEGWGEGKFDFIKSTILSVLLDDSVESVEEFVHKLMKP